MQRFISEDYSPSLQRFISEDPIGLSGGINAYSYVSNSPLQSLDPFGLKKLDQAEVEQLVRENNMSSFPDEVLIAIAARESAYETNAVPPCCSTAVGLMQITAGTLRDTHTDIPHNELPLADLSIQAGSVVLDQKLAAVYRHPNSNDTIEKKERRAIELYYAKTEDPKKNEILC